MQQPQLFQSEPLLPKGMVYEPAFLTVGEESQLLDSIQALPFSQARYKEWHARRRIVSYGGRYDFSRQELLNGAPLAAFLLPLRERIAVWSGLHAADFSHALVSEYSPGTPLGWHRDVQEYESIVGVSLAGVGQMRLRPYPPSTGRNPNVRILELQPRSVYLLSGPARWEWQHAISPTRELRYSITFRTLRNGPPRRQG